MNQGIIEEFIVLHLWPKDRIGRKLGVAITSVAFLVCALPLPLAIADPKPTTPWTPESRHYHYEDYESETGERVQIASVFFLVIGSVAFVLVIGSLILTGNAPPTPPHPRCILLFRV